MTRRQSTCLVPRPGSLTFTGLGGAPTVAYASLVAWSAREAPPLRVALSAPDVGLTGGIERQIAETANWLSRAGNEVTVYAAHVDREVLDDDVCVCVLHVPVSQTRVGIGFRRRAAAAIAADEPDVHGAFSALSPLGGVFWVPSVHRVAYGLLLQWRTPLRRLPVRLNPYHRVRLHLERTMLAEGGHARLLAIADGAKRDIVDLYGVPAEEIDVLPLGFDPRAFDPGKRAAARAQARVHFGYAEDDSVLVFIANELERKGFGVLLDAVARLDNPAVKILGAGRVSPEGYASQMQALGLTDRVRWVGSSTDVSVLHAAGDAFVLPTRYEAWGLVIVEALGSGLPVVTSRLAGAAIAVSDRETGWLLEDHEDPTELAAAIRWSLSSAPASAQAIAASVDGYTWEKIVERYADVLREVASQHSLRAPVLTRQSSR
jgi:UDP-glucose:(heptosyl)LPS alpha-1,3-glucosyltransferase